MNFPTHCPLCQTKLTPPDISWTHPSSDMLCCRNMECLPNTFYISVAASEHHVDGWGIGLTYNNKQYYIESLEDSRWQEDDEDLPVEQIVMIPDTRVEYVPSGDLSSTIIRVRRWYPYPNSIVGCQRILEQLVNLVPFT